MTVSRLPYDMGNAGDVIKHGMLAEFAEWLLTVRDSSFVFLDPFAGRPYVSPPHPDVINRVQLLQDCALKRVQTNVTDRYYGSAYLVKKILTSANRKAVVKVSDRNTPALHEFLDKGFEPISYSGFNREDSFSIINSKLSVNAASLLLLDPFDDFLPEYADSIVPKLPKYISDNQLPVILFLLYEDWETGTGNKWRQLNSRYLKPELNQVSLICPPIASSTIQGESRFYCQSVLLMPQNQYENHLQSLMSRLREFSDKLEKVLNCTLHYEESIVHRLQHV